jgi:hypothetical protein
MLPDQEPCPPKLGIIIFISFIILLMIKQFLGW